MRPPRKDTTLSVRHNPFPCSGGTNLRDAYTTAKGGIVALTRVLAVVWGPSRVRANCICPGGVDTPMIAPVIEDEQILGFMRDSTLLGRLIRPEETARVALFLASDKASYMSGAIVPVDGGWTVR